MLPQIVPLMKLKQIMDIPEYVMRLLKRTRKINYINSRRYFQSLSKYYLPQPFHMMSHCVLKLSKMQLANKIT